MWKCAANLSELTRTPAAGMVAFTKKNKETLRF